MALNILMSSANRNVLDLVKSGRSFTYRTNNKGPRTDPCGIPACVILQGYAMWSTYACTTIHELFVEFGLDLPWWYLNCYRVGRIGIRLKKGILSQTQTQVCYFPVMHVTFKLVHTCWCLVDSLQKKHHHSMKTFLFDRFSKISFSQEERVTAAV